ncbi:hypothetical protein L9F63_015369 [Diploptera punctata]|uniref:Uncharacterized protein n=1 Tax=Diploptera punctata TaxID=6984 RepID=A0AAD8A5S9_DIPPU|nr:hypothetical protein L9F63_015369 [Diploptera punctata]
MRFSFVVSVDGYHGDVRKHVTSEGSINTRVFEFKSDIENEIFQNEVKGGCKNIMCMQLELLINVSKIVKENEYNLTRNLVLEKTPGSKIQAFITEKEMQRLKDPDKRGYGYVSALLMEKTLDILKSHTLKWSPIPEIAFRVFQDDGGNMDVALEMANRESRTFGGPRKRLMFLLMPLMYKMGVMTTMLGGLIVLTLKMLTIGVILLILAVTNAFSKFKHHGSPYHHGPTDIHVHVHADPHTQAYSGWHQEEHPAHYHHRRQWTAPPLAYYYDRPDRSIYSQYNVPGHYVTSDPSIYDHYKNPE